MWNDNLKWHVSVSAPNLYVRIHDEEGVLRASVPIAPAGEEAARKTAKQLCDMWNASLDTAAAAVES